MGCWRHAIFQRLGNDGATRSSLYRRLLAIIGVLAIIAIVLLGMPDMLVRRLLSCETAASSTAANFLTNDGRPAITWDLILSDDERTVKAAITADMEEGNVQGASDRHVSWGALPYLMTSGDILSIISGIYSDHPSLSVDTCGSPFGVMSFGARYCVTSCQDESLAARGATGGSDANLREITNQAVDALYQKIEAQVESERDSVHVLEGEDYLFANWLCLELGRNTTYSDDVDDTPHANDMYGALVEGESKCYGLATAAKAVLDRRGIPAFVATGEFNHNPNTRHAVAMAWIDDQWRVLDATATQGKDLPESITMASRGYWGYVAISYESYAHQTGFEADEDCLQLMGAYENSLGYSPSS